MDLDGGEEAKEGKKAEEADADRYQGKAHTK